MMAQIIAVNTFWILFLRWPLKRYVLIFAIIGGWAAIGAVISAGPAALQKASTGPFCEFAFPCFMTPPSDIIDAISGYWCWISDEYASERITYVVFLCHTLCFGTDRSYRLDYMIVSGRALTLPLHIDILMPSRRCSCLHCSTSSCTPSYFFDCAAIFWYMADASPSASAKTPPWLPQRASIHMSSTSPKACCCGYSS